MTDNLFQFTHGLDGIINTETGQIFLDVQPLMQAHMERLGVVAALIGMLGDGEGLPAEEAAHVASMVAEAKVQNDLLQALVGVVMHTEVAGVRILAGLDPHDNAQDAEIGANAEAFIEAEVQAFAEAIPDFLDGE